MAESCKILEARNRVAPTSRGRWAPAFAPAELAMSALGFAETHFAREEDPCTQRQGAELSQCLIPCELVDVPLDSNHGAGGDIGVGWGVQSRLGAS